MQVRFGSSRIVFLTKKWAYKFPNPLARWADFLSGFLQNLQERYWYSADGSAVKPRREWSYKELAYIRWADCFGICVVMERVDPDPELTDEKAEAFYGSLSIPQEDRKAENLGRRPDGSLVVIDYGYVCRMLYLGDPVVYQSRNSNRLKASHKYFFYPIRRFRHTVLRWLKRRLP